MLEDAGRAVRRWNELSMFISDWRAGRRSLDWKAWLTRPVVITAVLVVLLIGGNFLLTRNLLVYAIFYNGQEIGLVTSRQAADEVRTQVQRELEQKLGIEVFLPATLSYAATTASCAALSPRAELYDIFRSLPWVTDGEWIIVNNKPVLAVVDRATAMQLLEQIKARYAQNYPGEKILEVRFQDNVTLLKQQVPVGQVMSAPAALAVLEQGQGQQDSYTVKKGDTLWDIARAYHLLVSDLFKANPQLHSSDLQIGQALLLNSSRPLLGVLVISSLATRETLPCEVQAQPDEDLWSGETKVLQPGADGEADVTYRLVRLNGQLLQRTELTRQIVKQPQPRLIAKGMRRTVALEDTVSRGSGSGALSWPVNGYISSPYGSRWGGFHTGVDICASYGTPVKAAAAGKVTLAGWTGGYGNCIIVDHGDGLATRYAHLSKIGVSLGEHVDRGEMIGNVGETGNATGSHLHFEVLVNGQHVNPMLYLR
jgi:murein DD-endopeptidase MepM/ murein hydrolase activator NlpD